MIGAYMLENAFTEITHGPACQLGPETELVRAMT